MPYWDFRRSANSIQILADLARDKGMPLDAVLAGTGLSAEQLQLPTTEVEATQELQVVRNLLRGCGHLPALGLEAGSRYHLTAYGLWGFALISSPTLRLAARLALRYLKLTFAFNRIELLENGDETTLLLDDSEVPPDVRQFMVERDTAALRTILDDVFALPMPVRRAYFRFARPAYADRFEPLLGVAPAFGQPFNGATVDTTLLELPLPQANEHTARMCETMCQQLLDRRQRRAGVAARVRERLYQPADPFPDMEQTAREFCMTSRSLRRHLQAEGTSYRALLDEVREMVAEQLLSHDGMTVDEVAARLGFAEASSFILAFKRWKGMSPRQFRQRIDVPARVRR